MRRYGYASGALLGLLLTTLAIVLVVVRVEGMPRVVNIWPLLAAVGTSVVTWWLQGVIAAVLARPRLKNLRVGDMFRVYMAGTFVALISPVRGAEIPYEVYLLKRLGLSAGEGSTVVLTRVLLDAAVLTPAALLALVLTYRLPKVETPAFLLAGLTIAGTVAAILFLVRRRGRSDSRRRMLRPGDPGRVRGWVKISGFFEDIRRSFALFWRQGQRATLVYAGALTILYWVFRLCPGSLALMAVGWSGGWIPVIVAQLILIAFVLPLVPTPGGSGARELGLATLLSAYAPEEQLLSGVIVYTCLTYCLPVIVGALFAGRQLFQGIVRREHETIDRGGYAEA
jgi:uncharacterized protein (TIRG00374 family)